MADELVYDACLEVYPDGSCLAQLIDLPACFARGTDEAQALASLELSIPSYFDWLGRHDEYTPVMRGPFRAVAAETQHMPDAATGAFFQPDAVSLSADDLDWFASLLDWSYQDYEAQLAADSSNSASLAANRLYQAQEWLLARIGSAPSAEPSAASNLSALQLVANIHGSAVKRVRAVSGEGLSSIHDLDGERWSLRKVLRRNILLVREATKARG